MSHGKLRSDNECENCGYDQVTMAYCPKCGQHNIETRQSFGYLVTHFAEDFTHYDSGFWKTIKYLLFRPAKLTKEYLIGKRQEYVPPVKLYIFISFVTFLLLSIISSKLEYNKKFEEGYSSAIEINPAEDDSKAASGVELSNKRIVYNLTQLDSVRALPKDQNIGNIEYVGSRIAINLKKIDSNPEELLEGLFHMLPKVLFIYMPIFAFWLWLFHGKKRWYFFDHGIFTLHYFAFLLLLFSIISIPDYFLGKYFGQSGQYISSAIWFLTLSYSFFYFFRAHRKMYGESRLISRIKSLTLFIINCICILFVFILSTFYAIYNLH